jgi:hypothetical protein
MTCFRSFVKYKNVIRNDEVVCPTPIAGFYLSRIEQIQTPPGSYYSRPEGKVKAICRNIAPHEKIPEKGLKIEFLW